MRGHALIVGIGLVVAACSGGEAAPTSPSTSAAPTTSTTTTTTVALTRSTEVETTTSVPVVDGIPEEALALIGAPMPDVPAYPDGFDPEVWFDAYAAWNQWAFANPEEGLASLDQWVAAGSPASDGLGEQLRSVATDGWRVIQEDPLEGRDFEVGDELVGDGILFVNLLTIPSGRAWVLSETGSVVAEDDFSGAGSSRSLLQVRRVGEMWRLYDWPA